MVGLVSAWLRVASSPDPPETVCWRGNNVRRLRQAAKLCAALSEGTDDGRFFLGSSSLASVAGWSQMAALRVLKRLEEMGVIVKLWTGGLCVRDPDGIPYADGALVRRASEYRFVGFRSLGSAKQK
jgi:hypothetical protein